MIRLTLLQVMHRIIYPLDGFQFNEQSTGMDPVCRQSIQTKQPRNGCQILGERIEVVIRAKGKVGTTVT